MKKIMSILLTLTMVLSLGIMSVEAADTSLLQGGASEVSVSVFKNGLNQGGQDIKMDASSYTNENTVVEVDYDFTMQNEHIDATKPLNIPFVLRSSQTDEFARFAIRTNSDTPIYLTEADMAKEYFPAEVIKDDQGKYTGGRGVVAKKGTIQMLIDYTEKVVHIQYKGEGFKESEYFGKIPFALNDANQLYLVNLGASGSPTIDFKVRAFVPGNFDEYKAFETKYTYEMDGFEDKLVSTDTYVGKWVDFDSGAGNPRPSSVYIPKDETNNHYVKIPVGNKYGILLQRQNSGWQGKFNVSFKINLANIDTTTKITFGKWDNVNNWIGEIRILNNNYIQLVGTGAQSLATGESIAGKWVEIGVEFDYDEGTMVLVYGGNKSEPVPMKSDIYATYKYLEHIRVRTADDGTVDKEILFDDLKIENVVVPAGTDPSITNLADDTMDFFMATFNPGTKNAANEGDIIIAVASYDSNGKLLGLVADTAYKWTSEEKTLYLERSNDAKTIRAFMWDMTDLGPVASIEKVAVNQ